MSLSKRRIIIGAFSQAAADAIVTYSFSTTLNDEDNNILVLKELHLELSPVSTVQWASATDITVNIGLYQDDSFNLVGITDPLNVAAYNAVIRGTAAATTDVFIECNKLFIFDEGVYLYQANAVMFFDTSGTGVVNSMAFKLIYEKETITALEKVSLKAR